MRAHPDARDHNRSHTLDMYARQVEEQSTELRALKHDERELTVLTVLCFGLALAAHGKQTIALPFLVAGMSGAALAVRALWRRWDLVDRLLLIREAYSIDEVRIRAEHAALLENRQLLASSIRWQLEHFADFMEPSGRFWGIAPELAALASDLEDKTRALDPLRAVECERLLRGGLTSLLVDDTASAEDTLAQVHRIRAGFALGDLASNY